MRERLRLYSEVVHRIGPHHSDKHAVSHREKKNTYQNGFWLEAQIKKNHRKLHLFTSTVMKKKKKIKKSDCVENFINCRLNLIVVVILGLLSREEAIRLEGQ